MTDPTTTPPLTPRQDAAVHLLETSAGGDVGPETPEGATGAQAGAQHAGAERVKRGPVIPVADHAAEDKAAWQQYAAARDREAAAQVDRWVRREQLGVLLSRMQRGVLLDAERGLLRAAVERELADAEQAWSESERLRNERDRARRVAVALEQELAALPDLLERSYPDDHGVETILEHLRGEAAWPAASAKENAR